MPQPPSDPPQSPRQAPSYRPKTEVNLIWSTTASAFLKTLLPPTAAAPTLSLDLDLEPTAPTASTPKLIMDPARPLNYRALNTMARQSIQRTLQMAPPLYPKLTRLLKKQLGPEPGATVEFQVDVTWVNDASMQAMNTEYRGKDKPTDVLSFPLFEGDVFPWHEPPIGLGDLSISIETAARQAVELQHTLFRETAFLAIHGTLHLLGYDHVKDGDRRKMFALQDAIFADLEASGAV